MNKKIKVFLCVLMLSTGYGWASPPTNVLLQYDIDSQTIHVEADHPTSRMERYFVRRVAIIKNREKTQDFYFPRQTRQDRFIADLNYQVEPGDHIEVQLYVTEGGMAQESFDVPGTVKSEGTSP